MKEPTCDNRTSPAKVEECIVPTQHQLISGTHSTFAASSIESREPDGVRKVGSCAALFFSVASTLSAEASKSPDGSFPYNSFTIPCLVEGLRLCVSAAMLTTSFVKGDVKKVSFKPLTFFAFALPAFCYFISNNCMFYIILELGPTIFQITNNLKVLATGVLMHIFLGKRLTWLRWKALILLVIGSDVTQLRSAGTADVKSSNSGFALIFLNSFAAGAGGVISEKLLKGKGESLIDPINWQNMQLYLFGLLFGLLSSGSHISAKGVFDGFNMWAFITVV